jgi:hypothetical protein
MAAQATAPTNEAYCMKCRQKRPMDNPHEVTLKNGSAALQSTCPVCGAKLTKMVSQDVRRYRYRAGGPPALYRHVAPVSRANVAAWNRGVPTGFRSHMACSRRRRSVLIPSEPTPGRGLLGRRACLASSTDGAA